MAAKRLGSALTNITGVAGQVLKVKGDESGFEFATPATIPAYTVTNKTVDRAINADDVTLDEVADVLATLIDDLAANGAPGATQNVYVSDTFNHTGSDTGSSYTITHNLGSEPDYWACQVLDNNNKWINVVDLFFQGSNIYGVQAKSDVDADKNKSSFTIYRHPWYDTATRTVRFICAKLGSTSGISSFTWSTSEQVWPFEKTINGDTLYCKEIDLGNMPNAGSKNVAHNISGLAAADVFQITAFAYDENYSGAILVQPLPWPAAGNEPYEIQFYLYGSNIVIYCAADISAGSGVARIIYKK